MGHRNDYAISALRAYARDLEATPGSGSLQVVGGSDQDGAQVDAPGSSGAPYQLAIAAVAVGVVLIGSIGVVSARSTSRVNVGPMPSVSQIAAVQPTTSDDLPHNRGMVNAAKAFDSIGLLRSAAAIESAIAAGTDRNPAFMAALEDVRVIVTRNVLSGAGLDESVDPLQDAVLALEASATRPPGLDIERIPPGQGGTPPGQDSTFTPPGQDSTFTPPGQDPTFTPPGQDPTFTPPGQDPTFTPPGQDSTFTPPGQDSTFTPPGQDPTFTPPGQDPTFTPPEQSGSNDGSSNATNGVDNSQRPDKSEPDGDS